VGEPRKPPAYQRYPMDPLGYEAGVRLTLAERGLKASIDDAIWLSADCSVPANPAELALIVRRPLQEVVDALPAVFPCFDSSTVPGRLVEPQMTAQMDKLMKRRKQLSEAGTEGNKERWGNGSSNRSSDRSTDCASNRSLSKAKTSQDQSAGAKEGSVDEPWVRDYSVGQSSLGIGHD